MPERVELDNEAAARVRAALKLELFYPALTAAELQNLFPDSGLYRYADGDFVIQQGEASQDLYIVHAGSVTVTQTLGTAGGNLAALGPGETFGEIAIVRGGFRSANVVALEPSLIYRLNRSDVARVLKANPELGRHLVELARKRLNS